MDGSGFLKSGSGSAKGSETLPAEWSRQRWRWRWWRRWRPRCRRRRWVCRGWWWACCWRARCPAGWSRAGSCPCHGSAWWPEKETRRKKNYDEKKKYYEKKIITRQKYARNIMRTASQTMLIPVIQFFYTTVQYLLLPPSGLWIQIRIQIGSVFRNCTDPHRKKVGKIRSKRSEIEAKKIFIQRLNWLKVSSGAIIFLQFKKKDEPTWADIQDPDSYSMYLDPRHWLPRGLMEFLAAIFFINLFVQMGERRPWLYFFLLLWWDTGT